MNAVETLHSELRKSFAGRPAPALGTPAPQVLARLAAVRRAFGAGAGRRLPARIAQGVMSFRLLGRGARWPDVKYACYGAARPMDWDGRVLLDDARLFDDLLRAVQARQGQPRRFADGYRGLLTAWLADVCDTPAGRDERSLAGRMRLKEFLLAERPGLARVARADPWLAVVLASGLGDEKALRAALDD